VRRVNLDQFSTGFPLPRAPKARPDPLFGQPEVRALLELAYPAGRPVLLATPPGYPREAMLAAFFRPFLAAVPEEPALRLVPEGAGLALARGGRPRGLLLRPAGRPGFAYLKNPEPEALFGRFLPRPAEGGPVLTFEDFRPGLLVTLGSGVLALAAEALAARPALAEALFSRVAEGRYRPAPPPDLPAPEFPALPTTARLVVAGPAEALEALPPLPGALFGAVREGLEATREALAWLWGWLKAQGHPLTRRELGLLAAQLARQAEHRERIHLGLEALEPALAARRRGLDLKAALEKLREARSGPLRAFLRELREGLWSLDLAGARVAEAVGLLVIEEGAASYGRPVRITASAGPGRDGVVSVEREAQLSGPLFNKAVLTLAGFLKARYAEAGPLSASLTVVFEQTSEAIDGDSAGLAELLAVLSALSGLPLRQDVALTGAIDQTGRVLPVGGVPTKAEGLLAAARTLGQKRVGLVLPEANLPHLAASPEVGEAVARGALEVYPVGHVDEAIELAFGRDAGRVHRAAKERLAAFRAQEDCGH